MTYLLVGNYGVGNLGDEALKEYFLKRFGGIDWKVVSARPKKEEIPRFPLGVRSFFKPWWRTVKELKKSDGIVFGGGSLFTDIESRMACILWWCHAFVAWVFKKPIYLAFQGIGPFKTCIGEKLTRWVVNRAEYISVRDYRSFVRIEHWFKHTNIIQSFDPVILLVDNKKQELCSHKVCIIIPRCNSDRAFIVKAREKAETDGMNCIFIITMQPDNPEEQKICKEIRLQCGGEIKPVRSIEELCKEISMSCSVVSQRYHGALIALALGKDLKIVSQAEGDKLSTIRNMIEDGESLKNMKKMAIKGEISLREKLS